MLNANKQHGMQARAKRIENTETHITKQSPTIPPEQGQNGG